MNRTFLQEAGWLDWAFEEAGKPFIYEGTLPTWTEEQLAILRVEYERRQKGVK
jgi:hypothetical protein